MQEPDKLRALGAAHRLVGELARMFEHVKPGNGNLSRHIREAAESAVLNAGEACGDGRPGKMANYFRVASGSANECRVGIRALIDKNAVPREYTYKPAELATCTVKMFTRLAVYFESLPDK